MIIYYTVPEIRHITDEIFYFSFGAIFCPPPPLTAPKMKISKAMKKTPGDVIILHKCTKNHDHMVYCSWDMACDGRTCYFSFCAIFWPFTPPKSPKNQNFKKKEENSWRYHHFTQMHQKLWLDDLWFLRYGAWQTDWRRDRKSDT